jgi:hypothetical protein
MSLPTLVGLLIPKLCWQGQLTGSLLSLVDLPSIECL